MPDERDTEITYVGRVAGIGGPVSCGWVHVRPLVHATCVMGKTRKIFRPFDLMKARNVVARVLALEGEVEERVAGIATACVVPGKLRGPMRAFLDANFASEKDAEVPEPEFQLGCYGTAYRGAVFADGNSIAVIGRVTDWTTLANKRVPIVTAIAVGVPPRALRHAREVALGLGKTAGAARTVR